MRSTGRGLRTRATVRTVVAVIASISSFAESSVAHVGSLNGSVGSTAVPLWLTIATGGVVVGASFLFATLLTDHAAIRAVNGWQIAIATPPTIRAAGRRILRGASVVVLGVIVASGLIGPQAPMSNFAILTVWAGWWAGYAMTVYLVGNTWPLLNPWRALASLLPRVYDRTYPERLGAWPSVVGLLGLVWLEVISPVAESPQLLVTMILGYSGVTLAGAMVYGADTWFGIVDPISRVFRCYGRIAPFQRTENGVEFKLPGAASVDHHVTEEAGATAFIIALLWVTTYDGLVSTPAWTTIVRALVGAGAPPLLVYFVAIVAGFGAFFSVYRLASRKARQTASSYVSADFIQRWLAPSLLPIAAGYHIAHFLGYFFSLSPVLFTVAVNPFDPPAWPLMFVIPDWFGVLQLLFVLVGHLLAIWVAHALSFDLFPGIFKPIRSQYPLIAVMILYTMTSMWVIAQPFVQPPYV